MRPRLPGWIQPEVNIDVRDHPDGYVADQSRTEDPLPRGCSCGSDEERMPADQTYPFDPPVLPDDGGEPDSTVNATPKRGSRILGFHLE